MSTSSHSNNMVLSLQHPRTLNFVLTRFLIHYILHQSNALTQVAFKNSYYDLSISVRSGFDIGALLFELQEIRRPLLQFKLENNNVEAGGGGGKRVG